MATPCLSMYNYWTSIIIKNRNLENVYSFYQSLALLRNNYKNSGLALTIVVAID
jgi:hypothetical protein